MITVACVNVGDRYPDHYVHILRDMVYRYLHAEHRFVCLSDHDIEDVEVQKVPNQGWWSKIELFRPGRFEGRVLYLDLDVCVVGPLDDLIERPGIIKDWHLPSFNSSVMVWDAGTLDHIHRLWVPEVALRLHGDQDWITEMEPDWPLFPEGWCVSFKKHCTPKVPPDARVVCFHGTPKPHEVLTGWVPEVWRIGGSYVPVMTQAANMAPEEFYKNMRVNCARDDLQWLDPDDFLPTKATMHIVGGGATLDAQALRSLRALNRRKHTIVACNGAIAWLTKRGLAPDFGIIMDGRESNRKFADGVHPDTVMLLGSTCDPGLVNAFPPGQILLWHPRQLEDREGMKLVAESRPHKLGGMIGGHSSVGLRAIPVGMALGFTKFTLWGMPSSLSIDGRFAFQPDDPEIEAIKERLGRDEGLHHAYPQAENDGKAPFLIRVPGLGENLYPTHGWMMKQADEFGDLFFACAKAGVKITAKGPGLLPDLCKVYNLRWDSMRRKPL